MITFFSTPKRFDGVFATIQENAIRSWSKLGHGSEIILFGNDGGTSEIAESMGLHHVADVEVTRSGVPLVSAMFRHAQAMAHNETLCYVNADVILTDDIVAATRSVREWSDRYLVVAQRRDLDVMQRLKMDLGWQTDLRKRAKRDGKLRSDGAIDLFLFSRGSYTDLPKLSIGRGGWDNFLLWYAVQSGTPLIDATSAIILIHQLHDYSHAGGSRAVWRGAEAQRNRMLIGHWSRYYTIAHAGWTLSPDGRVLPATAWKYRLARHKRLLSEAVRFTRPLRDDIRWWRMDRRMKRG